MTITTSLLLLVSVAQISTAADKMATLKTFGSMGKELKVLKRDKEVDLIKHTGKGALTHMWFGGSFKGWSQTRIRVYVDAEATASIDMDLFMGHGIGFNDPHAPWGTAKLGKTGHPSGVYNTYKIPFGKSIRVTAQLAPDAAENQYFWWIMRGTENLPVRCGGVELPDTARLKLYKLENHTAKPLEEFNLCNVKGAGALYKVFMQADGAEESKDWKDMSYQEACVRAYINGAKKPLFLSSGLEDYFLGTYYFNKGRYANNLAGLTHLDRKTNRFSAYRFHDRDPVFFQYGFRLTNRCGERIGDKVYHKPPTTTYTTYVWLYQW